MRALLLVGRFAKLGEFLGNDTIAKLLDARNLETLEIVETSTLKIESITLKI
jgi:hypothetical protein